MGDEAIGPVTVAMMVIGALLFLWPSLRPWIQELRARAQTGSAQRAVLRDLQALGKVRLREAENDGAEVAAALLDAASHPKAEMQGIKVTKSVNASEEKASPRKPSFATRFSLAEKANIANVVQEGSIAVLSERDSKDRHRNDDNDSSGRTNSFHATSLTQHNTIPTNSGAVTKTVGSGEGFVDCDLGGDRDDTYIFLSDVQPALERVLASIRNLDPLTKVIGNVVSHPSDPKYRTLKLEHPTTKKVWYGSQLCLLEALGYTEEEASSTAASSSPLSAKASSSLAETTTALVQLSHLSPSRLALHVHVAQRLRVASERRRDDQPGHFQGLAGESTRQTSGATLAKTGATTRTTEGPTMAASEVLAKRLKAAAATGVLSFRNEAIFAAYTTPADPLIHSSSSDLNMNTAAHDENSSDSLDPLKALRMVATALTLPECASRLRVLCLAGTGLGSTGSLDTTKISEDAQLEESSENQQHQQYQKQHQERIPFASLALGLDQPWASLQSLRNLDLDNNELTALPSSLSVLANLERLSVSHNRFGDSESRGSCSGCVPALPLGLQRLALAGNGLRRVPVAVAMHANLREVNLDLNRLKDFPEELFWCPRLERISLAGNLISTLPPKPTARPSGSNNIGSCRVVTPPENTAVAMDVSTAAATTDTSATAVGDSSTNISDIRAMAPLAALKHLDLSFNCFAADGLPQAWVFTDTLLEGLALDGNVPGLSSDAFLALPSVSSFMERRTKTKNKGQGGCWFAPGGVSSFGFCGLDHGNANAVAKLSK